MGYYSDISNNVSFNTVGAKGNTKDYNSQAWIMQCNLINLKQNINVTLIPKNINKIIIDNNIECHSPKIQFEYYDIGQSITKAIDMNNLLLNLYIIQPSPNFIDNYWNDQKKLRLRCLFYVNSIQVLFKTKENIMYRIHGIHYNQTYLKKTINFATTKQNDDSRGTPESPLKIIERILTKIEYPFSNLYVNDTENKVNFITSQSMNIEDCINYLLSYSPTKKDPPSYFMHNLRLNQAQIINSKILQQRLYNPINEFSIDGNKSIQQVSLNKLATEACDITNVGHGAGIKAAQFLGNFDYHNYNQNTRTWSIKNYNYKIIDNIFNSYIMTTDKKYQSVFPIKQEVLRNDLFYNFPNFNQRRMYKFLRQLQLTTNAIKFKTLGNVTRDAGQYVNLKCTDQQQIPLYEGLWYIYRMQT